MQQRPSLVQIRNQRDRFASSYPEAALLPNEVADRLLERLDYVRINPEWVVDLGAASGYSTQHLVKRYPAAQVLACDFSFNLLHQQVVERNIYPVATDLEKLPLKDEAADLIFSNLSLAWLSDPQFCFKELHRVLRPGGLLIFTSLGPDTLKELRSAFGVHDNYDHVAGFIDMHHLGDALLANTWEDPVMDMELLTLSYEKLSDLLNDLRHWGAKNLLQSRCPHLMPQNLWEKMQNEYKKYSLDSHQIPASFEIIYGHAWKGQLTGSHSINQDNEVLISVDSIKLKGD